MLPTGLWTRLSLLCVKSVGAIPNANEQGPDSSGARFQWCQIPVAADSDCSRLQWFVGLEVIYFRWRFGHDLCDPILEVWQDER